MKLLSWVQSKFSGRQETDKTNIYPPHKCGQSQKEEFSDWPDGFLSIGTLGNKDVKENEMKDHNGNIIQSQNSKDLTLEEVQQLQKELSSLITDDNLDCLASLEEDDDDDHDGKVNAHYSTPDDSERDDGIYKEEKKAKDVYLDNNRTKTTVIGKRSMSFLLKKMLVCGSGFKTIPRLRDPTLSPPLTRMEKILRAILHKKIYPQNPRSQNINRTKYLGNNKYEANANYNDDNSDDDSYFDENDGSSKWVKTDTEFIVLEI